MLHDKKKTPGRGGQGGGRSRSRQAGSDANPSVEPQRLHKILAQSGLGSRREIEDWIIAGRISVNGLPAAVGQLVGPGDRIKVNGKLVNVRYIPRQPRVLLYHKPEGEIVSRSDPEGRPTVFAALPRLRGAKWIAIGRLDFNSCGLLIFTDSGELANQLMHPRHGFEREYAARIDGELEPEAQQTLLDGVELEDGVAQFNTIEDGGGSDNNHWYHVTLNEGRNREVRRMFETVGKTVTRLMRVRYGPIVLPRNLKRGHCAELEGDELLRLLHLMGVDKGGRGGRGDAPRAPAAPSGYGIKAGAGANAQAQRKKQRAAKPQGNFRADGAATPSRRKPAGAPGKRRTGKTPGGG